MKLRKFSIHIFAFCIFGMIFFPAFGVREGQQGNQPQANRVNFRSPTEAYYAGHIESAVRLLSRSNIRPPQMFQLVALYWELGENSRAANLLERFAADSRMPVIENDEVRRELFITHVLMGNYEQAAVMRHSMESVIQRMDNRQRAEFYFHNALVYHEQGNLANAEEFYRRSLDLYRWRALAWYRLGTIIQDREPAEAETAFRTAWNQDRAFNSALFPLARLLVNRGEWEQARNFLATANARFPNDPEINAKLAMVLQNVEAADDSGLIRRQITAIPPVVRSAPITPNEGVMRIGLAENRRLISVRAGGDFVIRNAVTAEVLYTGSAREQFWVEWTGLDTLVITGANNRVLLNSSTPVIYELLSSQNTSIVAGVLGGSPGVNRTYRGALEFRPGRTGFTVVNIVNMGDYLYGVVPAEMPASWPVAALHAQAIAARSYAIAYRGTFAERGFDIWGDARSQAYNGVGIEHARTTAAVDATMGIVLVGESNETLAAYYSANHGGHSEDSLFLWGTQTYMQAVNDRLLPPRNSPLPPDELFRWLRDNPSTYSNVPGFFFANTYRWERWISPDEIRRRLIVDRRVGQDPGEIQRIVTRGRGISGRIVELEVQGSERIVRVRGDAIWFNMGGLRSSLFSIRHKMSADGRLQYLVFRGAGYGHGIGLDQHAAAGKASRGMSAEEILLHFYPRATLRQVMESDIQP